MKRITMNLSDNDVSNAEFLEKKLDARNKAQAMSTALNIAVSISKLIEEGDLQLKNKDGSIERIRFLPFN